MSTELGPPEWEASARHVDVLFVAALDWEAGTVLPHLTNVSSPVPRGWIGESPGGSRIGLLETGVGAERALRALEEASFRAPIVVSSGCAGALAPELRPGDLIIGLRTVRVGAEPLVIVSDQDLSSAVVERSGEPSSRTGIIATSPSLVGDRAERVAVAESTGADAVEMEGSTVGHWAEGRGARFLHVRAILDTVDADLGWVASAIGPTGRPKLGVLARKIAAHPRGLRDLVALAIWRRAARRSLVSVHRELLRAIDGDIVARDERVR